MNNIIKINTVNINMNVFTVLVKYFCCFKAYTVFISS